MDDVTGRPPSVVVLRTAEVLLASREELDGVEALDAVSAGHDSVDCGVQCTQLELALQLSGSLGPLRSQVLAVTTPACHTHVTCEHM